MKSINELIKTKRIYFDGGMGSLLQKLGLAPGELPENWNLIHPDAITDIHREYLKAGANVITTNTFGVNCMSHHNYEELIKAGISCAKVAAQDYEEAFVAFDVGPLGRFLKPIGDLDFEDAVEIFSKNIKIANDLGVDLIIIETMTDSYETKAAVLAAKENSDLPIFVTNAYDESGKLLTGASPEAMVAMLEGLGVSALGINCSFGPDKMIPLIKRMSNCSSLPIIANPNAGLPEIVDGNAVYSLAPIDFANYGRELALNGANILGGCCGTTPEHIKELVNNTKDIPVLPIEKKKLTVVSSYTHAVNIGEKPIIVGERINPTGKPRFKRAIVENDINYILEQGLNQADQGADILDINVGLPGIDEKALMKNVVCSLQAICDLPLQLDSNNASVLEDSMRSYNGKPLINSVNGEDDSMHSIFPLVKKYGGCVIALTLDNNGIPTTAQQRVEIANRIIIKAKEYGIEPNDIIFDPLALTIATDINNAKITLESVKMLSELGYKTSLGISNISYGLPNRNTVNSAFFKLALKNGLSCAIANPSSAGIMDARSNSLYSDYTYDDFEESIKLDDTQDVSELKEDASLKDLILRGLTAQTITKTKKLLESDHPLEIINNYIIPALDEVGEAFDKQEIYLPQLLRSAECSGKAFAIIKDKMPTGASNGNSVILATVKGDIHDIGKNIVKLMLESYGFNVHDLGKDVDADVILEACKKYNCKLVGLSALMTTTLPAMEDTIKLLHSYDSDIKIMVGGAVLTQEYAKRIGADSYGKDAIAAVRYAEKYYI